MKFSCSAQPTLNLFGPASRWWQLTSWMTLTSSSFTRWVETPPHTPDHFPLVFVSLLTRTLVVVLQGRDFPWSSCSRAFCWLPAEKPEQRVQAPICCLDLLLDCLTHQVSYKFREPPLFNFLSPIFWPPPTQNIIIQIFLVKYISIYFPMAWLQHRHGIRAKTLSHLQTLLALCLQPAAKTRQWLLADYFDLMLRCSIHVFGRSQHMAGGGAIKPRTYLVPSVTSQRADFSDSDQPFRSYNATPVMGTLHSQYIMELD